jgi:hypothetical protein
MFREWIVSIYIILPASPGPGVYSVSNRNEYQKQKHNVSGEQRAGWGVRLTTLLPSVSRLSRQCGILNISQPYRPPLPVTGMASLLSYLRIFSRFHVSYKGKCLILLCTFVLCPFLVIFWYQYRFVAIPFRIDGLLAITPTMRPWKCQIHNVTGIV